MIRRADSTVFADGVTPEPGVFITVKDSLGNLASLFDDSATPMPNPFQSGAGGVFVYNVQDEGPYTEEFRLSLLDTPRKVISLFLGDEGPEAADRAALASLTGQTAGAIRFLAESGREGQFVWSSANNSANVTADTRQGIYVAPASNPTGASGAWVRKFNGPIEVDWFGPDGVNDAPAITAAKTMASTLGKKKIRLSAKGYTTTATITLDLADLHVDARGATLNSSSTSLAALIALTASGITIEGLHSKLTGGSINPWHFDVTGQNVTLKDCFLEKDDGTGGYQFYVRYGADGFSMLGGRTAGSNGVFVEGSRFQFIGVHFVARTTGADDCIAVKAIQGVTELGKVIGCTFENHAACLSLGSEIGVAAANDSTYSKIARGFEIVGNTAKNCASMLYIKPGGVDGVDYRDGTVRGVDFSHNTLIDASGTNLLQMITISPGRGARVFDVGGVNNRVIGRTKTGGSNPYGFYMLLRNDGVGTADVVVSRVNIAIEVIDPYDGVAAGGSAPGTPFFTAVNIEKQSSVHGTASDISLDVTAKGTSGNGITIAAGLDNAIFIRRARLANIDTNGSGALGGINTASAITVGSDIIMSMAPGSFGAQYVVSGAGSVTSVLPKQIAASSLIGNPTGSQADATVIGLTGGLGFTGSNLTINGAISTTSVATSGTITSADTITSTRNGAAVVLNAPAANDSRIELQINGSLLGNLTSLSDLSGIQIGTVFGKVLKMSIGGSLTATFGASSLNLATGVALQNNGTPIINGSGVLQAAGFPALTGDVTTPGGSLAATVIAAASATGSILTNGGSIGFRTGAGGAVTQATSKSTGVTLNKSAGQITMSAAALAAAALVSFTVTNSQVAATDTINLNLQGGNATSGTYRYWIDKVSAGSFVIAVENRSAGSLSEALVFNFAVVKAVNA